jgi:hypothetical protein
MNAVTLEALTEKLKNAPDHIAERVLGYVDALVEPAVNIKTYQLSNDQQKLLDEQLNVDKSQFIEAEELYLHLKSKHGL